MNFIIEHYIQLSLGLILGLMVFMAAYVTNVRGVLIILLLSLPFQPVDTRYGSINMVLIYMLFIVFLIKGKMKEWPLFPLVMLIAFAYLLSMTQTQSIVMKEHLFYVIAMGSNFALFYIVYNYFRQGGDVRLAMNIFIGITALVLCHFGISSIIGFQQFAVFGVEELDFITSDEKLKRLLGPFTGAEFGSDFLALQVLLIGYLLMFQTSRWKQWLLVALAVGCFGFMVATGSRGGPIGLMLSGLLFLVMFRHQLGVKGLMKAGVVIGLFFIAAALVVVFTEFNVMFERLLGTRLVGFELDTRAGIFEILSGKIMEQPFLGHGPRLTMPDEEIKIQMGFVPLGFNPHSLYLFLLYTIGVVGLAAYMLFFFALTARWWRWRRQVHDDAMISGIPRLGLIIMFFFLLTEYRIEFLRFVLNDYQNYMFALWGALLAFTNIRKTVAVAPEPCRDVVTPGQDDLVRVLRRRNESTLLRHSDNGTDR